MIGGITIILLASRHHTSPLLLLVWNPWYWIAIRSYHHSLLYVKYIDPGSGTLPDVFNLQCGQKFTPILMSQEIIVCIFVIHFILYGCWYTVLGWKVDLIFREIVITDVPIGLVGYFPRIWRWRKVSIQIVHLTDALDVMEDDYPIGIHNVIVDIFNTVLKGVPMLPPHELPQLKP